MGTLTLCEWLGKRHSRVAGKCVMTPSDGYTTCPPTNVGESCTVTCAAGYTGTQAQYQCSLVNGSPVFVPVGAEASCAPTQYELVLNFCLLPLLIGNYPMPSRKWLVA